MPPHRLLLAVPVVFLARHGRGHRLIPSEVPYRANIHALKQFGVRYLLSFSAVGSLKEELAPLDMVLPDQFIDMTRRRENTFFGQGVVAHVSMAHPVCPRLGDHVQATLASLEAEASRAALDAAISRSTARKLFDQAMVDRQAASTSSSRAWTSLFRGGAIGRSRSPLRWPPPPY